MTAARRLRLVAGRGAVAIALALALSAVRAQAETIVTFEDELEPAPVVRRAWHRAELQRLEVRFPVGTLEVVGVDRDSIVLELQPECEFGSGEDCEKVTHRIGVRARAHGKTLELSVIGKRWFDTSRVQIEGRLEVPRAIALEVDMKVGELSVSGVDANTELRLGVGEATVRAPERRLGSAKVNVGIGEASLVQGGRSRDHAGVFGSGLTWREGRGPAALALRVGVGEASVYLD